ncbi:MAG: GspH/FimT family pseudopilin [Proteobacteria bacterium]|nr:GspH/FimT family pseudopilin [Pseudomonadota bacterium]
MRRARACGLTLVELMITIAVMAILMSLAAPSFTTLVMNSRVNTQLDSFFNGLNYARSAALNQSLYVHVCPVGAVDASPDCGAQWSAGWMVVSVPASGPATVLQSWRAATQGPVISSEPVGGTPATQVNFDPRGLAGNQANFKICDARGAAYARSLQVLPTGFVQAGPTPGQAVWGGALACP